MIEIESLLVGSRWRMLEVLAENPCSLHEIAKQVDSTTANVSSQLRLLEAAGIVGKSRLRESAAGKPRVIYHIIPNQTRIISFNNASVSKKTIHLSPIDSMLTAAMQLDIPQKQHIYQFIIKHAHKLGETRGGFKQVGTATHFGVLGDHSLPKTTTKIGGSTYTVLPKKITKLDNSWIEY